MYMSRFIILHVDAQFFQLHLFVEKTVLSVLNCLPSMLYRSGERELFALFLILLGKYLVSHH